ncbi:sodium:proline symporter [Litoreibacter janthinus]|uniref:Na+/proline symporter n=1 Tax=Litoreibacter janthinus TaxID=670154 RepID=A0A1I6HI45_9RHOB|nr:sodium:proline symporter [Litoreibacter janthinus]SFR54000.1 Na+/proline symporter [Litoreibacter janthinus]
MISLYVIAAFAVVIVFSFLIAPRRASVEGFFEGQVAGCAPGLWTLVLSQVTTWIFARSLMNSAILGYYYGAAGTLAYAAYYLSFLTGGYIIGQLRACDATSVQDWLGARFGAVGQGTYNAVIALRLLSEVFANLLVVGLIFSAVLPEMAGAGTVAVVVVAVMGLAYSAWGGLSAALRTDVVQMLLFLAVFGVAFLYLVASPEFSFAAIVTSEGTSGSRQGWVLLAVALLQVFSYPAHDPVMMDRGFIADRRTTRNSFLHAFWLSALCILAFGVFGIHAANLGAAYEGQLLATWSGMFPTWVFVALLVSLLVSALSTLDSALASAARLCVEELRLAPRSLAGGRVVMVIFMALGGALTLWGNSTLFDAVAVSGTASMFLTPVMIAVFVFGWSVPVWSYLVSFSAAIIGAAAYFLRSADFMVSILPDAPKYEQLLVICVAVLVVGFAAVLIGSRRVAD